MKIDPETINPKIWTTHTAGEWVTFLVDQSRFVRTKDLPPIEIKAPRLPGAVEFHPAATCDELSHPVAIALTTPPAIIYGLQGSHPGEDRQWIVRDVKELGLTVRTARAALAEAWRGVVAVDQSFPAGTWAAFTCKRRVAAVGGNDFKPQDATMLRNVVAWIHWAAWDKAALSMAQRAATLEAWGHPATKKALARAAEEWGL